MSKLDELQQLAEAIRSEILHRERAAERERLRDEFAMTALAGMQHSAPFAELDGEDAAKKYAMQLAVAAYRVADAMLGARQ